LVIEFGIANKELIVSAYLLKAVPPPPRTNTPRNTTAQSRTTLYFSLSLSLSLSFPRDCCYQYGFIDILCIPSFLRNENQHFQIIEQTQIECPMKKLDTIFALIQQAYEQCIEFEEKMNSLSSMNTFL
jgi:hypothetical protein